MADIHIPQDIYRPLALTVNEKFARFRIVKNVASCKRLSTKICAQSEPARHWRLLLRLRKITHICSNDQNYGSKKIFSLNSLQSASLIVSASRMQISCLPCPLKVRPPHSPLRGGEAHCWWQISHRLVSEDNTDNDLDTNKLLYLLPG